MIYHPSFLNPNFFWDDERFVFMNPEVLNAKSWLDFWNRDSVFFRSWPVGYSLFWTLLKISPTQSIAFFKSINIVVHGFNTFLLYRLFKKLGLIEPLFLSLFFLVHPLHVEAVSWIFQLLLLVSFSFFILSLICILSFVETQKVSMIAIAFVFFVLSLWTKSSALLAPFFLVFIFWYYGQKYRNYLLLIPFFLASLVIGLDNVDGTRSFSRKDQSKDSVVIFEKNTKPIENPDVKYVKDKADFDDVYSRPVPEARSIVTNIDDVVPVKIVGPTGPMVKHEKYVFKNSEIFYQGVLHYFSKAVLPINLQFMYPQQNTLAWFSIVLTLLIVSLPIYFAWKKKVKEPLIIPAMFISFVVPYLGVNEITFFYWSNVSDRYTYYFLAAFPLLIGMINKKYESIATRRLVMGWFFILACLNLTYGVKFNRPEKLYTEIITYKQNPIIYKLLFDEYLMQLDPARAEETLNLAIKKFPADPFLNDGKFQLENFKKNFIHHKLR
jgi:hypothetical protein